MNRIQQATFPFRQLAGELFDGLPYAIDLAGAIGPFGLEPRVRQLAALAVSRSLESPWNVSAHRWIGGLAGLTQDERDGRHGGLTAAERTAMAVALDAAGEPAPEEHGESPDHYFTSEEQRQLQAVALSVRLGCRWEALARQALRRPVSISPTTSQAAAPSARLHLPAQEISRPLKGGNRQLSNGAPAGDRQTVLTMIP